MVFGLCCGCPVSSSVSSPSGSQSSFNFVSVDGACSTCSGTVSPLRYKLTVEKTSGSYPPDCWPAFEGVFYLTYSGDLSWFDDGQLRSRCTWTSANQAKEVYEDSGCASVTSGYGNNTLGKMWQMYHTKGTNVSNGSGGFIHRNTALIGYAASGPGDPAGPQIVVAMSQPNNAPPNSLTRNCLESFNASWSGARGSYSWTMSFAIEPW